MTRFLTHRLAQLATAAAVTAFAWSLAQYHPEPSTAAESRFLTLVLGLTLGALALAGRSAPAVVSGGALTAVALCLPAADGTRGALIMALLAATAVIATWRTFVTAERVTLFDAAALTVGWQCILRSERLIDWQSSPGSLAWLSVWLLALPLAAAVAAWWHSRRHGGASALALVAGMAVLGPGFGVVPVAVLVVAAALTGRRGDSWPAAVVAAASCIVAIGWQPVAAGPLLVLTAALALRRHSRYAWLAPAGAVVWAVAAIASSTAGDAVAVSTLSRLLGAAPWLVFAAPLAVLAPPAARPLGLAALALAVTHSPPAAPALLAPALALAILALPDEREPRRLQAGWSLALLGLAACGAAYPWLRQPAAAMLDGGIAAAIVAGAAAIFLASLVLFAIRRRVESKRGLVPAVAAGLLLLVALGTFARQPRRLNSEPILLTAGQGRWEATRDAGLVRQVTIDSFLSRSERLRAEQPVAFLVLTAADGARQRLAVRQGLHTSDWAARRLAQGATRKTVPAAWLSWLAGDGTLAQRYRASWRLEQPLDLVRIDLVRAGDLAPEPELAVLAVTVR